MAASYPNLGVFRLVGSCVVGVIFFPLWLTWRFVSKYRGGGPSLCNPAYLGGLPWGYLARVAFFSGTISQFSTWLWYYTLTITSASANTAVEQSSPAFVYLMSLVFLGERPDLWRGLAVAVTVGGVVLVSLWGGNPKGEGGDSGGGKDSFVGYLLVTVNVIGYATNQIIRVKYASSPTDNVPLANGLRYALLYGVMPMPAVMLACVVLHVSGVSPLILPTGAQVWIMVTNACYDSFFVLFLYSGLLFASPTFMNVGNLLVLPASILLDWVVNGYAVSWQAFCGIGCILLGFLVFVFREREWEEALRQEMRSPAREVSGSLAESLTTGHESEIVEAVKEAHSSNGRLEGSRAPPLTDLEKAGSFLGIESGLLGRSEKIQSDGVQQTRRGCRENHTASERTRGDEEEEKARSNGGVDVNVCHRKSWDSESPFELEEPLSRPPSTGSASTEPANGGRAGPWLG